MLYSVAVVEEQRCRCGNHREQHSSTCSIRWQWWKSNAVDVVTTENNTRAHAIFGGSGGREMQLSTNDDDIMKWKEQDLNGRDKELEWLLECEERVYKIISTDIEEAKYDNEDYVNSYVDRKISLKEEIEDLKMQVSEYKHQKIPNVKEDLRVAKADLSLEQKRLETLNKENEEYLAKVLKLEEQERNLEEHCRILDKNCKPNEKDLRLIASAKQIMKMFNVGKTQVYKFLKKKMEILKLWEKCADGKIKIELKKTANKDINEIVWEWFVSVRAKNHRVSGPVVQEHAKKVSQKLVTASVENENDQQDLKNCMNKAAFNKCNAEDYINIDNNMQTEPDTMDTDALVESFKESWKGEEENDIGWKKKNPPWWCSWRTTYVLSLTAKDGEIEVQILVGMEAKSQMKFSQSKYEAWEDGRFMGQSEDSRGCRKLGFVTSFWALFGQRHLMRVSELVPGGSLLSLRRGSVALLAHWWESDHSAVH
uniref:Uncharacterized protein n=1 Tax=Timema bartmani TaxID=61472 RepID=A0A7R9EX73_9NEOP|nr:unnamed protein product [Timema bartmani]